VIRRHPRSRLRHKQRFIAQRIIENENALIVSGMGSGKTAATLTAIRELRDRMIVNHVLVIAPLRVARDTWPDEIETWEHTAPMTYAVAVGTPEERAAAVEQLAEITIINRENLVWLAKHLGSIKNWPYDMVVIDESSMFKAGKRRTTRAKVKGKNGETRIRKGGNMTRFGVLCTARRKIDRVVELTGTPAPNGVHDLWGQIYLLDQGERLGRSMTAFEKRWYDKNKYTYEIKPKPGAEEEIIELVKPLMVSLPQEDSVPIPVIIPRNIQLPQSVMKEYRSFEASLVSQTYDVEAVTRGVLSNKLLQFSNGSMYREDGSIAAVHDCKLKELDALVEEAQGENLLILYSYKFDLEAIRKRYPDAVVFTEEPDAVRRWNEGKINKLLAHPASCAHGLNMQYGGHICVWYGLTWSLELWEQANARLARPGQKEQVSIYPILAAGTYDQVAYRTICEKGVTQGRITESVVTYLRDSESGVT